MRQHCNQCGDEMSTGRCDKCCMLCQEGYILQIRRLEQRIKDNNESHMRRTLLLEKQNEAYMREAARIHALSTKPKMVCVENGALILDPPRPIDNDTFTDIEDQGDV